MLAIYKRELRSYFQSMIGCVFVAFLVLFTGIYFTAYNLTAGYPYFSYTLSGSLIVFIVGIPLITMRSFSEERKNKTDQLLLTAPVSLTKVVLGKYFAMATVVAVPNFVSTFGVLLLLYLWNGIVSFLPSSASGCMAGLLLILSVIILYIWQMTLNWVLSAILEAVCVIGCVTAYFVKPGLFENLLSDLLGKLAFADVFTGITQNHIVDLSGIVLYLSVITVFIFLTVQTIQKRRWS